MNIEINIFEIICSDHINSCLPLCTKMICVLNEHCNTIQLARNSIMSVQILFLGLIIPLELFHR